MKLQDLTIDQFQRIAALEFSPVLTDYDKRAGVVAIVEGVDVSLVREMPAKGLTTSYPRSPTSGGSKRAANGGFQRCSRMN
jgi:hypothetical protein